MYRIERTSDFPDCDRKPCLSLLMLPSTHFQLLTRPAFASQQSLVTSISWTISLVDGDTLLLVPGAMRTTSITLRYSTTSGEVVFSDVGSSTFSGWLDLATMVKFSSALPGITSVDSVGTLTLFDNWYEEFEVNATMFCTSRISASRQLKANLLPAEMDVDLGENSGFQFQQQAPGTALAVQVHVRPRAGFYMTSFQIRIGPLDPSILNSALADGAYWNDASTYSGILDQLDNPSTEAVLAASNPESTVQDTVTVGTFGLGVVSNVFRTHWYSSW